MGSIQELQRLLKSKEEIIRNLEHDLTTRDELIEQLKSKLDKYQSIIPKSLTEQLAIRHTPRKQRTQGISAAPQGVGNLNATPLKKYSKPQR